MNGFLVLFVYLGIQGNEMALLWCRHRLVYRLYTEPRETCVNTTDTNLMDHAV